MRKKLKRIGKFNKGKKKKKTTGKDYGVTCWIFFLYIGDGLWVDFFMTYGVKVFIINTSSLTFTPWVWIRMLKFWGVLLVLYVQKLWGSRSIEHLLLHCFSLAARVFGHVFSFFVASWLCWRLWFRCSRIWKAVPLYVLCIMEVMESEE